MSGNMMILQRQANANKKKAAFSGIVKLREEEAVNIVDDIEDLDADAIREMFLD